MSSGFVSGGTVDQPTERDDEWRAAQAEIEEKRRLKAVENAQHDGKSLYEVLQANKAAKQDAFEEAARLKNQYRALDDDEADFLDSVLEGTRRKEQEVKRETMEELDRFRKKQEAAEAHTLGEGEAGNAPAEAQAAWVSSGRKRKKGPELLKGVKVRRKSSAGVGPTGLKDDSEHQLKQGQAGVITDGNAKTKRVATPPTSDTQDDRSKAQMTQIAQTLKPPLGLAYASSDDDD